MAGRETEAEAVAMIKTTDALDKNDQIVSGSDVYDIIDIGVKPNDTNSVVQVALLKLVRP